MKKRFELQQLIVDQQVPHTFKDGFRGFAKAFLLHLTPRVKDDGSCFDSYENILHALGCARPTLTKITTYWRSEGIMTWEKGIANQHGERKASVYHFDEAAMQERLKVQAARETDRLRKQIEKSPTLRMQGKQIGFPSKLDKALKEKDLQENQPESARETDTLPKQESARETDVFPSYPYGTGVRIRTTLITRKNTEENESSFSEDQNTPQADPTPALMSTPALENTARPRMTLAQAERILKAFESSAVNVICADCFASDADKDGRCAWRDFDGSPCGSTRLVSRATRFDWFKELEAQWEAYQKQRDAEHKLNLSALGLTLKDIVGRLDVPSMERQSDMTKCRDKAATTSIAERRAFAKECYDSGKRHPLRKAWFLYATGMLDDEDEPEPWVTQLFADFEALEPRDGESK